jgi:hypothetical protein
VITWACDNSHLLRLSHTSSRDSYPAAPISEQISNPSFLSEASSGLITMARCSLWAVSSQETSKIISTYLCCHGVFAARCTCHSIELLPRCLPYLLPGQRCPCFWQSPEWLCTLINESTKEPNTVLRWPIARACDNLVGPIYPPHNIFFMIVLRRRLAAGLWPSIHNNRIGWVDELRSGVVLRTSFGYTEGRIILEEFQWQISQEMLKYASAWRQAAFDW